nr:hypothetical protein [Tepidiforma sp.]
MARKLPDWTRFVPRRGKAQNSCPEPDSGVPGEDGKPDAVRDGTTAIEEAGAFEHERSCANGGGNGGAPAEPFDGCQHGRVVPLAAGADSAGDDDDICGRSVVEGTIREDAEPFGAGDDGAGFAGGVTADVTGAQFAGEREHLPWTDEIEFFGVVEEQESDGVGHARSPSL